MLHFLYPVSSALNIHKQACVFAGMVTARALAHADVAIILAVCVLGCHLRSDL